MSAYIEDLAARIEAAFAKDENELRAVLWDIRAESWEDGVMWKGGIGTIRPEREPNPYRKPPLELPTEPTWGIAVRRDKNGDTFALGDEWYESDESFMSGLCHWLSDTIVDFIPLTPEQVERIEAAR